MKTRSGILLPLALLAGALLLSACRPADAPPPGINYYVETQKPHEIASATDTVHAAFDELLQRYVNNGGEVDFEGLANERAALDAYLARLGESEFASGAYLVGLPDEKSDEAKAFWINAHNAAALAAVLDAGVPESVTAVSDFFERPVFNDSSLREMRNFLRERWQDPRVHFILWWAANGGPILENHAFVAADLDWRLNRASVRFLTDRDKNMINPTDDIITHSPMLKEYVERPADATGEVLPRVEYGEDFGRTHRARRLWVADYITRPFSRYLRNNTPSRVAYSPFDWSLPAQPKMRPPAPDMPPSPPPAEP